jgi:hypothetical protein
VPYLCSRFLCLDADGAVVVLLVIQLLPCLRSVAAQNASSLHNDNSNAMKCINNNISKAKLQYTAMSKKFANKLV